MKTKRFKSSRKITALLSAIMLSEQLASTGAVIYAHAEDAVPAKYTIEHKVTSSWDGGCTAEIILTNNADVATENWSVTFCSSDEITNLWGGKITDCQEITESYYAEGLVEVFKEDDDAPLEANDNMEGTEVKSEEEGTESSEKVSENELTDALEEKYEDVSDNEDIEVTTEESEETEELQEEEIQHYFCYTIESLEYNAVLPAGDAITIGYSANGNEHRIWDEKATIELKKIETEEHMIPVGGTYAGDGYTVDVIIPDYWANSYNVRLKITNTSNEIIHNWAFVAETKDSISNLYNAVELSNKNGVRLIKNAGYNQDIPVGGSVEVGYTANYDGSFDVPDVFALSQIEQEVTATECEVSLFITDEWEDGGLADIILTNISELPIEDWMLEFDSSLEIVDIWGGVIEKHEGEHYLIRNAEYAQNMMPGENWIVGILFSGEAADIRNVEVRQVIIEAQKNIQIDDGLISINTDDFIYMESIDSYNTDSIVESISGSIQSINGLKELIIDVYDINEEKIFTSSIVPANEWTVNEPGLVIGFNHIYIKALFEDSKEIQKDIILYDSSLENMKYCLVDNEDDDQDGLSNYIEYLIGLNKESEDSDNDGLPDMYEIVISLTSPIDKDTDGNGIYDGDEDPDQDQLSNRNELTYETNPLNADSDYDGLSDYEEILIYGSSALMYDTDGDSLSDSVDVDCSLDPTLYDTDNDGLSDSEEIVNQKIRCRTIENKVIDEVSITVNCKAENHDDFLIVDSSNYDYLSANVRGIIGCPVEIVSPIDFDSAQITFSYNEDALGNTKEEDLCMMWYDVENLEYVLLDDCVVDKQLNTVTYETTHFSTYLLVDKTIWLDAWRNPINYYKNAASGIEINNYDVIFMVDYTVTPEELLYEKRIVSHIIDGLKSGDRVMVCGYTNNNALYTTKWYSNMTSASVILHNFENYASKQDFSISATGLHDGRYDYAIGCATLASKIGVSTGNETLCFIINDGKTDYTTMSSLDESTKAYKDEMDMAGISLCNISISDISDNYIMDIIGDNGMTFIAKTSEDIMEDINNFFESEQTNNKTSVTELDLLDSDGDGLLDTFEMNGMMIQNGTVVYTDPYNTDTDGDGISDCDEMGGNPMDIIGTLSQKPLTNVIWHQVSDPLNEYSSKFEKDYMLIDSMDYLPYQQSTYNTIFVDNTGEYDSMGNLIYGARNKYGADLSRLTHEEINSILARVCAMTVLRGEPFFPVATKNLDNYISGDTERRVYDLTNEYAELGGLPIINWKYNVFPALKEAILYMHETGKNEMIFTLKPETTRYGEDYSLRLKNIKNRVTDSLATSGTLPDLFFGINAADASFVMHVSRIDNNYYFDIHYYVMDYYDWDPTIETPIGLVSAKELNDLTFVKVARAYENWGYKDDMVIVSMGDEEYSSENVSNNVQNGLAVWQALQPMARPEISFAIELL